MIRQVDVYKDDLGREVSAYVPCGSEGTTLFTGKVRIRITPPAMNDPSQVLERDFEFPMPDDVTTIDEAFARFDEVCKKRIEERKNKVRKCQSLQHT